MCEKKVFIEYCDKAPKDFKKNSELVIVIKVIWKLCNPIVESSDGFEQATWGKSPSNWTWPKRRTGNEKQQSLWGKVILMLTFTL